MCNVFEAQMYEENVFTKNLELNIRENWSWYIAVVGLKKNNMIVITIKIMEPLARGDYYHDDHNDDYQNNIDYYPDDDIMKITRIKLIIILMMR